MSVRAAVGTINPGKIVENAPIAKKKVTSFSCYKFCLVRQLLTMVVDVDVTIRKKNVIKRNLQ